VLASAVRALQSFAATAHPMTQHHLSEELNEQKHQCVYLKSSMGARYKQREVNSDERT